MKMKDVLNDCLGQIFAGKSIEDCLENYPGRAKELEPLLRTSQDIISGVSSLQVPDKARLRSRLIEALSVEETRKIPRSWWLPRWAVVVSAVLVLLIAFSGTAVASIGSQPDSLLIPFVVELLLHSALIGCLVLEQRIKNRP